MNIGSLFSGVVSGIVKPVTKVIEKKEETKKAKLRADAKIAQAELDGKTKVTLTDAEWEAKSKDAESKTWKDEYVTIIITLPLVGLMFGGVWLAFTGDSRLIDGINIGIESLTYTGVDMGTLMYGVVFAAIGIKLWRAK